jgi:hypothetical protein
MTSPRERSAARILERIRANQPEQDPSVPIMVSADLIVWPDGRFIAALPAELVDDVESVVDQ